MNDISTAPFAPGYLQWPAKIFSWLLHPIFIPVYVFYFIAMIHPTLMAGFAMEQKKGMLLIVLLNLVFFPLFTVALLKGGGFIDSIFLRTQKDRIIPLIALGIFYFWCYTVFKEQENYPRQAAAFVLGIFFASSAALMANIYFKISLHAIGAGGLLGFFSMLAYRHDLAMVWPLAIAILLAGIICSSRLILQQHDQKDVYVGLLIGIVAQVAGFLVVGN